MSNVELKHIDLDETMVRAIAKQAEAERMRRAKIIDAEGELQAAEKLAQAGDILSGRPGGDPAPLSRSAAQGIAGEEELHDLFPLPIDLFGKMHEPRRQSAGT